MFHSEEPSQCNCYLFILSVGSIMFAYLVLFFFGAISMYCLNTVFVCYAYVNVLSNWMRFEFHVRERLAAATKSVRAYLTGFTV